MPKKHHKPRPDFDDTLSIRHAQLLKKRTPSELLLEQELTQQGINFEPQYKVGCYFLDFRIFPGKFGVEVDGGYHLHKWQKRKDLVRTMALFNLGWRLIRFTNEEIEKDAALCVKMILKERDRFTVWHVSK